MVWPVERTNCCDQSTLIANLSDVESGDDGKTAAGMYIQCSMTCAQKPTSGQLSLPHVAMVDAHSRIRRPSRLELTARTSSTNYFNRPFQALSENVLIRADIAFGASKTFCLMNYISLLTYIRRQKN